MEKRVIVRVAVGELMGVGGWLMMREGRLSEGGLEKVVV
jgi:hypothetical protein